jgi:hypothetical protein
MGFYGRQPGGKNFVRRLWLFFTYSFYDSFAPAFCKEKRLDVVVRCASGGEKRWCLMFVLFVKKPTAPPEAP